MTEDRTYNGWTNYETWCINLWNDNDQGSSEHWAEIAAECWSESESAEQVESGVWTREEAAKFALADRMKTEFEEGKNDLLESAKRECSVWADLIGAALSEVHWDEIAGHLIEQAKEGESA